MLAVVVINYRSDSRTIGFVKNEITRISIPHKVIIVNNGASSESDVRLADSLNGQIVKKDKECDYSKDLYVISSLENLGFARGNNLGAKFAIDCFGVNYILFTNNDIHFLDEGIVEKMRDKLEEMPEAGFLGPKIIGLKGECQSPEPYMSFWDRHIWMYLSTPFMSKERKAERFKFHYSEQAREGFHYKLMGSFFMVKAKAFEECGMMDEATFLYAEEPILTERMAAIGMKPYYYPSVSVLHEHGVTTNAMIKKKRLNKLQFKSECYYYQHYKHTPALLISVGKIINVLISIVK